MAELEGGGSDGLGVVKRRQRSFGLRRTNYVCWQQPSGGLAVVTVVAAHVTDVREAGRSSERESAAGGRAGLVYVFLFGANGDSTVR